jgi:hypothetical protein
MSKIGFTKKVLEKQKICDFKYKFPKGLKAQIQKVKKKYMYTV